MGCPQHPARLDPATFKWIDYPSDDAELTCRVRDGFVGRYDVLPAHNEPQHLGRQSC
jgi:hypothetical protein